MDYNEYRTLTRGVLRQNIYYHAPNFAYSAWNELKRTYEDCLTKQSSEVIIATHIHGGTNSSTVWRLICKAYDTTIVSRIKDMPSFNTRDLENDIHEMDEDIEFVKWV